MQLSRKQNLKRKLYFESVKWNNNEKYVVCSVVPNSEWSVLIPNENLLKIFGQTYGDGSKLVIRGVQEADAGLYRCTGRDPYGHVSYDDLILEVIPGEE